MRLGEIGELEIQCIGPGVLWVEGTISGTFYHAPCKRRGDDWCVISPITGWIIKRLPVRDVERALAEGYEPTMH